MITITDKPNKAYYELTKLLSPGFSLTTSHPTILKEVLLTYARESCLITESEYKEKYPGCDLNIWISDNFETLPDIEQVYELLGTASGVEFMLMEFEDIEDYNEYIQG